MTTRASPNVVVKFGHKGLWVWIGDLPHMFLKRESFLGFTSWVEGHPAHTWVIEFVLADGRWTKTEYDTEALWRAVLHGIAREIADRDAGAIPLAK